MNFPGSGSILDPTLLGKILLAFQGLVKINILSGAGDG